MICQLSNGLLVLFKCRSVFQSKFIADVNAFFKQFLGVKMGIRELRTLDGLADSCACQVAWRSGRSSKRWQTDHPEIQKGGQERMHQLLRYLSP